MSAVNKVGVTSASGRMGQAQVRQLLANGKTPTAFSRSWRTNGDEFREVKAIPADFSSVDSMTAAFTGMDAILNTIPSFAGASSFDFAKNFVEAAKRAGVRRIIHNSAMWAPEKPCGEPLYDMVLQMEDIIADPDLDVTIFRPVLFMDNLLTLFQKPNLVEKGLYRYCQKPGLLASWISMDDLGKFMVEALDRPDLIGRRIVVAGPETIPVEQVVSTLSEVLGKPITYVYENPYDLAAKMHGILGLGDEFPLEAYAGMMDSFYTFNNESPVRPFVADMELLLKEIPIKLTPLREWAMGQDWSMDATPPVVIGSPAG